jgi:hypothetical protein
MSTRAAIAVLVAVFVVAPATGAAARVEPCAADRKFVDAWNKVFNQHVRITAQQTELLAEILQLTAANEPIPRSLVNELQLLITRQNRLITSGEKTLKRLKPGTANGIAFKRLVLRYLRVVARPLNTCIARMLAADTPAELQGVIRCVESTESARRALSKSLGDALAKMKVRRAKCG